VANAHIVGPLVVKTIFSAIKAFALSKRESPEAKTILKLMCFARYSIVGKYPLETNAQTLSIQFQIKLSTV